MIKRIAFVIAWMLGMTAQAQTEFTTPTTVYLMHSSGHHLKMASDYGGQLEAATVSNPQKMTIEPDGSGNYYIKEPTGRYLSKLNSWNTSFVTSASGDDARFMIEPVSGAYVRIRCKGNDRYLGTDANDAGAKVFSDKNGSDVKHYWFFSDKPDGKVPTDTLSYTVFPSVVRQHFYGWGVSLCWWAGQCGKWTDRKIDEIVTWLTSPTGLNYQYFRYNIGGGDDPENRNCTPHHMGSGKGLRAEMEGFKDFTGDEYHWDRDEAQRKIMLKIREKRPDAVFEAFSNSCPYYMTYSGCVSGNVDGGKDNLKPEYYEEFAHYLVDVCKHYKDEYGIEFTTLEPFNESVTNFSAGGLPLRLCLAGELHQGAQAHPRCLGPFYRHLSFRRDQRGPGRQWLQSLQAGWRAFEDRTMEHAHLLRQQCRPCTHGFPGSSGRYAAVDERGGSRRQRHRRQPEPGPEAVRRHALPAA